MSVRITAPGHPIRVTIQLPASKSLSNRTLIIRALSGKQFDIGNLSEAEDTQILLAALSSGEKTIDVGAAGTAMRFLTSYFAVGTEEKILTGTERMKQRPIAPLADALNALGADIGYLEKPGCPPLKIKGKHLAQNNVEVDGSISSQFLSALLLIGPVLPNGLTITIKNTLVSKPYAEMTMGLMKHFGVDVSWQGNRIEIPHQTYKPAIYTVEADWSAAAFWYCLCAIASAKGHKAQITLPGLQKNSMQGDSVLPELMKQFGVETEFSDGGIVISNSKFEIRNSKLTIDFIKCPDLAQSLTVLAAALDREIHFTGIENLKIKETDRITALQTELQKFGKEFIKEDEHYILNGTFTPSEQPINTYDDHRMVMAFTPLTLLSNNLVIETPETVKKSYPEFWMDLLRCGWKITVAGKS